MLKPLLFSRCREVRGHRTIENGRCHALSSSCGDRRMGQRCRSGRLVLRILISFRGDLEFSTTRRCRSASAGRASASRELRSHHVFICCPSLGVHTENNHLNSLSVGRNHEEISHCHASNSSILLQRKAAVFAENGRECNSRIFFL